MEQSKVASLPRHDLRYKYFPEVNFMEARLGYRPSYVWRSILAGMELLSAGLI